MNKDFLMGFGAGKAVGSRGGGDVTVEALSVSSNGTYTASTGKAYSPVTVSVPNSYAAGDEGKVVSSGALVAQTAHAKVTQNGTIDTALNNSVEVDVANSYTAGDEGKVVSNGALVSQSSDSVTQNGTVDTTLINSLTVNVSGGGGASNVVTGTFELDSSGIKTIEVPYNGNGFPVAVVIFLKYPDSITLAGTVMSFLAAKYDSDPPTYSNSQNPPKDGYFGLATMKNSAGAGIWNNASKWEQLFANNNDPSGGTALSGMYRLCDKKTFKVWGLSSSGYGFALNKEYTYYVVYSS